jgi:hypothetical protein
MRDQECPARRVAVSLSAKIDIANSGHVGEQLRAACVPGVTAVIPEMGLTVSCCASGRRQLVAAHKGAMNRLTSPMGRSRGLPSRLSISQR